METEYLRQFALLAKECHFQTAAELLYINQSTLSKHIAVLEKELGHKLFHRTTRQVQLSEFGRKFLPYAEKIIGIVNDCDSNLISKSAKARPALHVGLSPFASVARLMACKLSCQETVPEIASMVFTETSSPQLRAGLKNGRFQMVIDGICPLWEDSIFAAVPYMQDHLCALLAAEHPLSQNESLSLHELRKLPYIHLYTETNTSPFLSDPVSIADTVPQVLGAVSEGRGYSILPYERIKKHLPENVRSVRLAPSPDLQFYAYYLRQAPRSEALAEILKYFAKNA